VQSHLRMMTSVDYGLQIVTAAGGIRRINDSIRILIDGRNQGYMQEWLTFQSRSPIQNSDESVNLNIRNHIMPTRPCPFGKRA